MRARTLTRSTASMRPTNSLAGLMGSLAAVHDPDARRGLIRRPGFGKRCGQDENDEGWSHDKTQLRGGGEHRKTHRYAPESVAPRGRGSIAGGLPVGFACLNRGSRQAGRAVSFLALWAAWSDGRGMSIRRNEKRLNPPAIDRTALCGDRRFGVDVKGVKRLPGRHEQAIVRGPRRSRDWRSARAKRCARCAIHPDRTPSRR